MFYKLKYPNLNKLYYEKQKVLENKAIDQRKKIQIWKFNHQWKLCYESLKFYKNYKEKNKLPNLISDLSEIKNFPIIDKNYILKNYEDILIDYKNSKFTLTGGTSGDVIKFPTSYVNEEQNFVNKTICKNWINSNKKDKTLYIWGHSHKFGNNFFKKKIKTFFNKFKDFDQNRFRLSAYDMSQENLENMHQAIRSNNFDVIFSYASTFEILSKYLLFKNYKHQKKIKLIFTSEHLSEECIQNLIKIFPESEIIGEYGMAETGIIAYSMDIQDEYKVIWSDFIIQNIDEKILISEIANKHFPLINYCPDDQIILNDKTKNENSIFSFSNIKGKERPFIDLKFDDNTDQKISLIIFDHLFKNIETIFSVQYFINSIEDKLIIIFSGNSKIENLISVINNYFKKKILNIELMKIQYPIKTKAGKFKTILDEKDFSNIKLSS